ncbi:MFS transporter [Halochromatium glycolicum]|nr:MFS transporter [Halochromatium glycolicum]
MAREPFASMSPWYGGYAFQGVVVLGTAPILLPLIVGDATGPAQAGLVVAALYIGQLTAPMFGALADGSGRHRLIYAAGYLLLAVGLGLFPLAQTVLEWFILALMQGLGVAATNTVASMFIVEFRPKAEWDRRIGWMQTCYGIGQAAGLGLAALLQQAPAWGMLASAALMLPGLLIGLLGTPRGRRAGLGAAAAAAQTLKRGASISDDATSRRHAPPRQILPHGHIGPATGALLGRFLADLRSPYALFMLCWLLVMLGTWLIYNLYPLLMQEVYGVGAGVSSVYYAVGAGIGVFAYAPSGILGQRIGDGAVVLIGSLMSLLSVGAMAALAFWQPVGLALLGPLAFLLLPVAWSPLIVAGTAWAAQLSTMNEGEAVGILNSTTALASVAAAFGAGVLASRFGFDAVLYLAAAAMLLGLLLLLPLRRAGSAGASSPG